ncbi:MAG: FadR family transcriptional regulator [Firmicutes bacterium]|nr:FadR family transcriptional regulator [Bacillota bacterium]
MEPIKRVRVVDTVSEKLVRAISEGKFEAGTKLPSEHDLAQMLQVSRNALREAVRQLETMGFVTVKHGDGTYINHVTGNYFVTRALQFFKLRETTLTDLVEAREAIEVTAAMLAAERAWDEEIETILKLVDEMDGAIDNPEEYVEKDFEFHVMVIRASKNEVLRELFSTIQDILMVQLRKIMGLYGVAEESYGYHREIALAISTGDPQAAADAMRNHFRKVAKPYVAKIIENSDLNSEGEG